MVDDHDYSDEYRPTEEDLEAERHLEELVKRYPTFLLLFKALTRHRRRRRLIELTAPQQIVDQETEMREEALDALADAFPYDSNVKCYHFVDVLTTLVDEVNRPYQKGGSDA